MNERMFIFTDKAMDELNYYYTQNDSSKFSDTVIKSFNAAEIYDIDNMIKKTKNEVANYSENKIEEIVSNKFNEIDNESDNESDNENDNEKSDNKSDNESNMEKSNTTVVGDSLNYSDTENGMNSEINSEFKNDESTSSNDKSTSVNDSNDKSTSVNDSNDKSTSVNDSNDKSSDKSSSSNGK
jgi:hypothetical protein